jgi:hypothetical protein
VVPSPEPRQLLFRWLLPVSWAALSLLGFSHPGDEYTLFLLGALAGVWVVFLTGDPGSAGSLLPLVLGAGVVVMLLFGWMLDRLRAELWLWVGSLLVAGAIAGYVLLQGYADFEAALQKQGSLLAFLACGLQLGGYAAILVCLSAGALRLRPAPGHPL